MFKLKDGFQLFFLVLCSVSSCELATLSHYVCTLNSTLLNSYISCLFAVDYKRFTHRNSEKHMSFGKFEVQLFDTLLAA